MKITIELTNEELEGILETAGSHGSGYWARTREPLRAALKHPVRVYDAEKVPRNAETFPEDALLGTLTRVGLQGAANRMVELAQTRGECKGVLKALIDDPDLLDSLEADAFVQIALFGECRYG